MANEQLDARALLAKMEAERKAAQDNAKRAEEEYEAKSKALLAKLREQDLADVIAKCKMHGFTASDLRGALKTRGGKKSTPRKSAARKTTRRKSTKSA